MALRQIKKLNILSFARFLGLHGLLLGLVAGIIYSFGGLLIDALVTLELLTTSETPGLSFGTVLAFGALVGMPLIGMMIGVVAGFFSSIFYNLFARWFGGINIEYEQER